VAGCVNVQPPAERPFDTLYVGEERFADLDILYAGVGGLADLEHLRHGPQHLSLSL